MSRKLKDFKSVMSNWQKSMESINRFDDMKKKMLQATMIMTQHGIPNMISVKMASGENDRLDDYFNDLVGLRRRYEVFRRGRYEELYNNHLKLYVYTMTHNIQRALVILNFSDDTVEFETSVITMLLNMSYLNGNYDDILPCEVDSIRPYEARIYIS